MVKKYWFYFGMGTKRSQVVHKNGIVGGFFEFFPIIDVENSVMEEDQVTDFHVVNFFEVPEEMFFQFKEDLQKPRPHVVEPEPEEIDAGNAGGGLGALGVCWVVSWVLQLVVLRTRKLRRFMTRLRLLK